MNDHDPINHPSHYTSRPVECIEITRLLPFSLGNAVKYAVRAGLKGDPAEDIAKCKWYARDHRTHQRAACPHYRAPTPEEGSLRADCLRLAERMFPLDPARAPRVYGASVDDARCEAVRELLLLIAPDGLGSTGDAEGAIDALLAHLTRTPKA